MALPSTTSQLQSPPTSLDSCATLCTCTARCCTSPDVPRACTIDFSHVDSSSLRGEKKVILPPFHHISQIAAGGHHDPTGDIWRSRRNTSSFVATCDPPLLAIPKQQGATKPPCPSSLQVQSLPAPNFGSTESPNMDNSSPPVTNDDDSSEFDELSNDSPEDEDEDEDDDASVTTEDAPLYSGWDAYTAMTRGHDGRVMYKCLWDLGDHQSCGYTAKRQLVKRHIENTHMKIKRFKCQFCTRRFAQKSSRNIHQNSHTGEKPHPCMYQCGKWFRDPSKRTRHAYRVHAYEPKPRQNTRSHR